MNRHPILFAIIRPGVCLTLALFTCGQAYAQTTEASPNSGQLAASVSSDTIVSPAPLRTLSLAECYSKADRDNKDIAVAKKNLAIAKAGIQIASAIPNPLAQVQLGFGPSFTELFTGQTQQVFFTEQLQTAGKRTKKINAARAFYDLTELQFEALRFDVHNRVRAAYAELVAAEAYAALIEAQREVSLKLATIAKHRFDAGKAPKSEVLQADLSVLQFDTQRNQAQGRLQQDSAALALVIGEKPEHIEVIDVNDNGLFKLSSEKTDIVPSPNIPLSPLDELLTMASNHRPDLQVAKQQVFVNERALSLARAQKVPNLFVGSGFTFSTFARHQPVGLVPQPNWLGQGVFINVSSENPIFYQHQGEVDQALANLRNSERQVDLLKTQIACGTVIASNAVKVSRDNIFLFQKDLLPLSSRVAKLARRGYEVGATDLATAIVAQQQYQQTLSNYFDAVVAYQIAWTNLERAVGVPLRY
jgi:cobalt-zinc-cadmium efflux system outer membrane protein